MNVELRSRKTKRNDIICYLVAKGAPDDGGHALHTREDLHALGDSSGHYREILVVNSRDNAMTVFMQYRATTTAMETIITEIADDIHAVSIIDHDKCVADVPQNAPMPVLTDLRESGLPLIVEFKTDLSFDREIDNGAPDLIEIDAPDVRPGVQDESSGMSI